jgi:putative ABC transport system permease protein
MSNLIRIIATRLLGYFGKRVADREINDEIDEHIAMLIDRYISQGMSEDAAMSAAQRQFGNIALLKEEHREMRGISFINAFIQDLRYGLTMMRRNPGFTFVAALTLTLGIGAITAIFSMVNSVLLRSLPYRDPDRLVIVARSRDQDFLRWREQAKAFEALAAYDSGAAILSGGGEPEQLAAGRISAELFATLGVAPALGRAFTPEEDTTAGAPVVLLSHGLWRRRFGGDPQTIGRAITIDDRSRTVIGIMPPGFRFPEDTDLWLPLALNPTQAFASGDLEGSVMVVSVIARLKPGVTLEAARANLPIIRERKPENPRVRQEIVYVGDAGDRSRQGASARRMHIPADRTDGQVSVIWLRESLIGDVRRQLLIMFGAVGFVLLIACANTANLLLSRSAVRQKEMAIRAAVGAGRLRLVRQLMTESLLLSAIGGAAGLLVATWAVKLMAAMSPAGIVRINESRPSSILDVRVLGFTCLVVLITSLLAGAFPALQASKVDVNEMLKAQSTAGSARSRRGGLRALPAMMIAEIALALVLLVGAGLMIKSFLRLMAVPKGFNPEGVLSLTLSPSQVHYPPGSPRRAFYFQEALARVQALPGVQSAGLTGFLPLTAPSAGVRFPTLIEGRPEFQRGSEPFIALNHVSPDYFKTIGLQIRTGRPFAATDGKDAPRVAIINETIAQRFFPNEDPIGRRLLIASPAPTIVGVVGDTRHSGLDQRISCEVYLPYLQHSNFELSVLTLTARIASDQNHPASAADLFGFAAAIRDGVRAIDPGEPIFQVGRMDERLSNSVAERRFQTLLLSCFAGLALVIAVIGIYGVISYAVSQRTHEIGVRMALGAQTSDVLRLVVWRGMRLTLIGAALGLAGALALTRVIKTLLFNVTATDPATFTVVAMLLVIVALMASYIPARRAAKVDPLTALRSE